MKAYGVDREDGGCCPGHDKYPGPRQTGYYNNTSRKALKRGKRGAKKHARQVGKLEAKNTDE